MTAVRRSGRERKQATSMYDEAVARKEAEEAATATAAKQAKARSSGSAKKSKATAKNGRGTKKRTAKKTQEDEDA